MAPAEEDGQGQAGGRPDRRSAHVHKGERETELAGDELDANERQNACDP